MSETITSVENTTQANDTQATETQATDTQANETQATETQATQPVVVQQPTTKEPEAAQQPAKTVDPKVMAIFLRNQALLEQYKVKYPNIEFIDGSMHQNNPASDPKFAQKMVAVCVCPHCGVKVKRATSDFFTFDGCPECRKALKKGKGKGGKSLKLPEGIDMEKLVAIYNQLEAQKAQATQQTEAVS